MKVSFSSLVISALFATSMAQAAGNAGDISATLTITGNAVADPQALCTVSANANSVYLSGDISNLINQGDTANNMTFVPFHIKGNEQCSTLIEQGRISYRFTGTADTAEGTALANSSTGENAASGVAIGLFDNTGKPLKLNDTAIIASATQNQGVGFQVVKLKDQNVTAGKVHGVLTVDIERL
ncbi:type 1 fimbrial protein [Cronobacter turicensis]|nr:type 1 fimbrial protein [Cronobacter turicensis]ELY3625241.1 type 1 fimbrial protein [Cronobacter turicensis]